MRVGVIGTGAWAEQHAAALATLPGPNLVAVSSRSPERAQAFARRWGARAFPDHHALLEAEVDAVLVATPHDLHAPLALEALRRGKAVLLEKPPVITPAENRELHALVQSSGAKCLVGLTSHYLPGFQAAKAWLERGELGHPLYASSVYHKVWMDADRQPWHLERARGGGMLLTVGLHAVDRALWLLGGEVRHVFAVGGTRLHAMSADDLMSLLLDFGDGVAAQVSSLGYVQGVPANHTEVLCEGGLLRATPHSLEIGQGNAWEAVSLNLPDDPVRAALAEEWLDLYAWWREDRPPRVMPAYASTLMDVLFRAQAAACAGLATGGTRVGADGSGP